MSPVALKALTRIGAVAGVLLSAACTGIEREPQPQAGPQAMTPSAQAAVPNTRADTAQRAGATGKTAASGVVPSKASDPGPARAAAPPPKAPAKSAATPPAAVPAAKSELPAAAQAKPQAAAPLDLKSLEKRLKETQAIGVFTKVTLKNQIDELLEQFRAFYQGKGKVSLAELRRSYDRLVLKVLALLQEADPPLASAIAGSREAIWAILSDRTKFATV